MKLHPKQTQAFNERKRNQFILAGRRGGKTILIREKLLERIHYCPAHGEVFYIGPTLGDAKSILWDPIQDRLDELGWSYRPLISKHYFEFSHRRKLYVIGAEKIRKIRGHSVFFAALDEVAYYDTPLEYVWKAVRPALTDLKGRTMVTTTPNGAGTDAYDFYLNILKHPEDWAYSSWGSSENPHIDKQEIELAKRELDEKAFRQEYEAHWESFEGLAYYNFDARLHISPCKEIDISLPIDIALDFNVNPTTLLVTQFVAGKIYIRHEYCLKNSSTIATIKQFCLDHVYLKNDISLRIYGDAAGHGRASTTGHSDYFYIRQALDAEGFRYTMCVPGANPSIVDRVQHLNSWLKNYHGETRIQMDPSCSESIRDLSSQQLEGRHPSDKNNLGHRADAIGYLVAFMQMQTGRRKQGTIHL